MVIVEIHGMRKHLLSMTIKPLNYFHQRYYQTNIGQKYFPDRFIPDALLAEWNKSHGNINLDKSDYTFKQVYDEFSKKNFPTKEEFELEKQTHKRAKGKFSIANTNAMKAAYHKCNSLNKRLYKSLRKDDFMNIILKETGCQSTIQHLANLFKKLDDYATENDIIIKGYAHLIKITSDMYVSVQYEGNPYTYEEINEIGAYEGEITADITLSTIYTGARIEELLFTKIEDVYIDDQYFVAGLKTTEGKRRIIPIHSDILHIFRRNYELNKNNEFLFTIDNKKIDYNKQFLPSYREFMENLGMHHKTHDGRKTLHSELDRLGANVVCVNKIFGHKGSNVGDDRYTKKSIEELKETIEMVHYKDKKNTKITYLKVSNNI